MPIYELDLENIGPLEKIHFEFDPQINVFVGPNNCGKSTVQMSLGDIAVYGFGVPEKLIGDRKAKFKVCKGPTSAEKHNYEGRLPISLGTKYWNGKKSESWIKTLPETGYGCFIPALRQNTDYRAESAESEIKKRKEGRRLIMTPDKKRFVVDDNDRMMRMVSNDSSEHSRPHFKTSASVVSDEELIQKMIDLDYKGYRQEKPEIKKVLHEIGSIASEITEGFPIEFLGIAEDKEGLYPEFKTPDGKMPINVLSQGTQSVIQWIGLLLIGYAEYYNFPKNLEKKRGVVIIDEVDAHMHPSWQRRILPTISSHFPNLQIFCSSHSPFVLAGLKIGQAQLLRRDNNGKVIVSRNEKDIVGWSTDEILRNFLDITNATDLWTSKNIERLQEVRRNRSLTKKESREIVKLRNSVKHSILGGPAGDEIKRFAQIIRKHSGSGLRNKAKSTKRGK